MFFCDRSVAVEGAVAVIAAESVVFGHEYGHGDPGALIDYEIVAKFGDFVPVEESQVD